MEKTNIYHDKLAQRQELLFDFQLSNKYMYSTCSRDLTVQKVDVLNDLSTLEEKLAGDTLNVIVCIGGYIESKLAKSGKDIKHYYHAYEHCVDFLN